VNKNVVVALSMLVAAAVFSSLGAWSATADSQAPDVITPTTLHGPSVGSFAGDVRHLPQGNKPIRDDDAQPNGKAPDEALHGQPVTDTVVKSSTGGSAPSAPT